MEMENEKLCAGLEDTTEILPTNGRNDDLLKGTAIPKTSPPLESDVTDSWENQLNTYKQRIEDLQEEYGESYLEIGKVLVQARDIYKGHGNWLEWLKENVPFSVRHAQRLIRVAEMFDDATTMSRLNLRLNHIFTRSNRRAVERQINTSSGSRDHRSYFHFLFCKYNTHQI